MLGHPHISTLFPYTTLFRSMRLRLGKVTVADVLAAQPVTTNLLKFMRASIKMIGVSNLQSFIEARINLDRKSGSAGMPRPISYAVFCLKKKKIVNQVDDAYELGDTSLE